MRTREFLSKLEHDRIIQAIRTAESKTSGEIRVLIQRGKLNSDPFVAAQKKFHRLRMHKTRERNAVLIFVAPRVHKFAVVGDQAIHEKCGDEFWQRLVDAIRMHFQTEKFTHALVEAVNEIGKVLGAHFPKTSTTGQRDKPPPPPPPASSTSITEEELAHARVLGLRGRITFDDVKRCYRERMQEYHPDKVNSLGQKLREVADSEAKKINAAYEFFRRKYDRKA
ncbi:MAG: TPM domain-containing protein [Candidatus Udaeobacter sp.]